MRKIAPLGGESQTPARDEWYSHHNRGSGAVNPLADGRERIENVVDRETSDRATELHENANQMAEHGMRKDHGELP
jgi:hypothetical protein